MFNQEFLFTNGSQQEGKRKNGSYYGSLRSRQESNLLAIAYLTVTAFPEHSPGTPENMKKKKIRRQKVLEINGSIVIKCQETFLACLSIHETCVKQHDMDLLYTATQKHNAT